MNLFRRAIKYRRGSGLRPNEKSRSTAAVMIAAVSMNLFALTCAAQDETDVGASARLFGRAEDLSGTQDAVGRRLMAVVENRNATLDERFRAIELLGKLQYLPANPTLIRHIDLEPESSREPMAPPAARALRNYGDAAVPQIIHAYLQLEGDYRESENTRAAIGGLIAAIAHGKTAETARIYLKGIAADPNDPETKRKVDWFLKFCSNKRNGVPRILFSSYHSW